ncbi:MAG: transglycosylase domain-containing protein [Bellilinea sp.]
MRSYQRILLVQRRRHRQFVRQSRAMQRLTRGLQGLAVVFLAGLLLAAVVLGTAYASLTASLPPIDSLPVMLDPQIGTLLQPTRIYDRTGEHLLATLENPGIERRMLPLNAAFPEALSPALAQAVVLILEPDFWDQSALTWQSLTGEHAPTIAERLVNNLLLGDSKIDITHRLRTRLLANRVLDRYGRAQVLEWYLNSASFGHLTFGADSAARLYLGKSASQLDGYDAAVLVAALEAPALNWIDAPAAARERQLDVLSRMTAGGLISQTDLAAVAGMPPGNAPPQSPDTSAARAFSNLVVERLAGAQNSWLLERGGLHIITSLDYDLQQQTTCAIQVQLSRLERAVRPFDAADCPAVQELPNLPLAANANPIEAPLAASAVLLDPLTGQVLALTGEISLAGGEAELGSHPSGSLQTPFLALAGFARSLGPASLIWDIPLGGTAEPATAYHGPVRLRTALANDYLAGLTTLFQQVGAVAVTTTARSLGLVDYTLPGDLSQTLTGGPALDPLELAQAFSVFSTPGTMSGTQAKDSNRLEPQLILSVEDAAGTAVLGEFATETRQIVSPQLAYLVHHILADEPARWPGLGQANPLELDRPAGAKTGSADQGRSTWAAGYTRQFASVVWLGYQQPDAAAAPLDARATAGIWHALMQVASQDQPVLGWNMPSGVTQAVVCDPSGLLPTAECPNVVTEVFLTGSEPVIADDLYRRLEINRETGRLATIFTPQEWVETKTFLIVPPEAQEWSRLANLPVPPLEYDNIPPVELDPAAHFTSPAQFSFVRGKLPLTGTAAGEGFVSYRLQLGRGINPTQWQNISEPVTNPVENGLLGELDTAGLDGLYIVRLMVVYEGQRVQLAYLQVTADNTPPTTRIPYPLPGQVFAGLDQRTVTLQTEVSDAVGVARVEWWLDGRKIGGRTSAPYALIWDGTVGRHTLQVRAIDLAGNESRSEEIEITVQ